MSESGRAWATEVTTSPRSGPRIAKDRVRKQAEAELIAFAATFPGAWEDHPWDHTVMKVGKKVFVFFGGAASPPGELSLTVKLPVSYEMALTLPYMSPAGHGLWKGGWAALRQRDGDEIDLETISGWIVQSYRAVATKKLVKQLDAAADTRRPRDDRLRPQEHLSHPMSPGLPGARPVAAGDDARPSPGGADLRVGGKIFASPADRPGGAAVVKLTLEQREMLCAAEPDVFAPVVGMGASQGLDARGRRKRR